MSKNCSSKLVYRRLKKTDYHQWIRERYRSMESCIMVSSIGQSAEVSFDPTPWNPQTQFENQSSREGDQRYPRHSEELLLIRLR